MAVSENLKQAINFFSSSETKKESLNNFQEIAQKDIQSLINLFTEFYGEEHRQYIASTINSVKFIFPSQMSEKEISEFDINDNCRDFFEENLKDFKSQQSNAQAYCFAYLDKKENFQKAIVLPDDLNDYQVIHELNHILEMRFLDKTKEGLRYFTGFDLIEEKFGVKDDVERDYEAFNEVVNEIISKRIFQIKVEMGIKLWKEQTVVSNYLLGEKVATEFIEHFMPDLIHCRIKGQPEKFKDLIGEEIFESISKNLKVIMSYSLFELKSIAEVIHSKTGKEFANAGELIKYAEDISQLDLEEKHLKFFNAIVQFKKDSTLAIQRDCENELY